MNRIRRIADSFQEDEHRILGRSTEAEAQAVRSRARGGLSGLAILILLALATIAIERDTRRRIRMAEALRDSEAQFRQAFEESPSAIVLIEDDQRVPRSNP